MKFQFSMFDCFVFLTLAAAFLGIVFAQREIAIREPKNRELRRQAGELTINDPSKIHAIQLPMLGLNSPSADWNIFVPSDQEYSLFFSRVTLLSNALKMITGYVPAEDVVSLPISAGKHQLTIRCGDLAEVAKSDGVKTTDTKDLEFIVDGKRAILIQGRLNRSAGDWGSRPNPQQRESLATEKLTVAGFQTGYGFDPATSEWWKIWIEATKGPTNK